MTSKTVINALSLPKIKAIVFALFLAIAIIVPSFFHSQWVTGPVINATLILATVLIGPMEAVLIGLMPSTIALVAGLLPLPLAPMVPFIMIGNAILVVFFHYLKNQNYAVRLLLSAFFKFAFLHLSVTFVMARLLDTGLVAKLAVMMSWPQFITAVIGGIVVYPAISSFVKRSSMPVS